MNVNMNMKKKHFIADIGEMAALLEARLQRNLDAVRSMDRDLTPVENARFETGWGALRDQITSLREMQEAWERGHPVYRKVEKMIEDENGC